MQNEAKTTQTAPSQSKSILILSPFEGSPLLHGSIVRTHFLMRYLALTHQIWFVCRPQKPADVEQVLLNHPHRLRQLLNFRFLWQIRNHIEQEDIDLIIVSHFWIGLWGILLKWLTGKPLLYDAHNVEYIRLRRQRSWIWPLVWLCEWVLCRTAGLILCVSEVDRALLVKRLHVAPTKIQVAENGANISNLATQHTNCIQTIEQIGIRFGEPIVLFFGTVAHGPNREAIRVIVEHLAPRVQATFVIAGKGSQELAVQFDHVPENVVLAGFVDDIVSLIKCADLVIAPLLAGSGTRFKIIESVACGRPVVSTTIGAEGIDRNTCAAALIISDSWDAFVEQINLALQIPTPVALQPEFVAKYDWQSIWERVDFSVILP